jgi:glycosyltransferase involved in cell wall biosynthesis
LLVAVGDVVPYKQIHVLVEALAQDSHLRERCALRVIGRKFPDFYPVERRARELGLTDCVRFLGYQPVEVMYAYLAAADVYLGLRHPTEGETSGALIRALERGRTAVVSDNGWYAELPDDCVVKVEAPVRVEELRRVLRALVEDSGRRREIGARAAAHVRSEYSLGTFVERILAFSVGS